MANSTIALLEGRRVRLACGISSGLPPSVARARPAAFALAHSSLRCFPPIERATAMRLRFPSLAAAAESRSLPAKRPLLCQVQAPQLVAGCIPLPPCTRLKSVTNYNPGDLLSSLVSPSLTSEHARAALSEWISARDLNHKLPRSLCKNIK